MGRSRNAWQQYAAITVNIINNPPRNGVSYSFSTAEVTAITNALTRWKDSPTCADISFVRFIVGPHDTTNFDFSGTYISFAKDEIPLNDGFPVLARTELASNGAFLVHASTYVDRRVTNILAFEKTIAHEFGHTFGLRHCAGAEFCGSVMDNTPSYNDTNYGSIEPTACDVQAAKAAGKYVLRLAG